MGSTFSFLHCNHSAPYKTSLFLTWTTAVVSSLVSLHLLLIVRTEARENRQERESDGAKVFLYTCLWPPMSLRGKLLALACGSLMICLSAVSLIFSPTTVALLELSALSWTCPVWPCFKSLLHVIFLCLGQSSSKFPHGWREHFPQELLNCHLEDFIEVTTSLKQHHPSATPLVLSCFSLCPPIAFITWIYLLIYYLLNSCWKNK